MSKYFKYYFAIFCFLFAAITISAQTDRNTFVTIESPFYLTKKTHKLGLTSWLKKFEVNFEVNFIYKSDLLQNIVVSNFKINPQQNVAQNLKALLTNTEIAFTRIAAQSYALFKLPKLSIIKGAIYDQNKISLHQATIQIKQHNNGTFTNLDGNYQLEVEPGSYDVEVSYVGFKPIVKTIEVDYRDTLVLNFDLVNCSNLEEIVLVGTRFNVNSLLTKAEPADIVKQEQLEQNAQIGITQLLQYSLPSFHSTYQTISDGTDHIDPAALRGLGPDQLLVLINGKRRHSSSLVNINGTVGRGSVATDLNAIPTSAIEKIEVLRDGAAVQYGSSAIAGVINIVLKEDVDLTDINGMYGLAAQGDGAVYKISGNYGVGFKKSSGFLNVTADFTRRESFNRSGAYTGTIFGNELDQNAAMVDAFFNQVGYDKNRVMSVGSAEKTSASLFFNTEIPLAEKIKLYAFGGASYQLGQSSGFYRFPYQQARQSGIYPMGFSPQLQANIFDDAITIGLKSKQHPWQIDFSNTIGHNQFDFIVKNSNNASLGLASPTRAHAGGFSYMQNVTNLDINKSIQWRIPIYFGAGSEFRLENYKQKAGEESSWLRGDVLTSTGKLTEAGIQMFPGFRPENEVDEYRYNLGVYANVDAELSPSWLLSMGSRYEHYSDFGSRVSWKLGSRYTFKNRLTFRGAYNTGFRAPSIPQIYFSSRGFHFFSQGDEQVGTDVAHFNNLSSATNQFGILPLAPETSKNYSLGFATQTLKGFSMTLDFYRIDIQNRIVITGRFSASDHPDFREILETHGVSKAQFFTNAIDTKTKGVDCSLQYRYHLQNGSLKFNLASNFNTTRIGRNADGSAEIHTPELLQGFESILFNREEISRIEVAQPGSKTILSGHYQSKKVEIFLALTRFGAVQYIHPDDGDPENWPINKLTGKKESRDQLFRSKWITDLNILYHFDNHFSLSIGGNNIFNVYPDKHSHSGNISNGLFTYSRRVQQFGLRGAFFYTKMNYKF